MQLEKYPKTKLSFKQVLNFGTKLLFLYATKVSAVKFPLLYVHISLVYVAHH